MVRIPVEYQEVEYLESDGGKYLNLPYGFLDTDEIELVCEIHSTGNDEYMISPSVRNNNNNHFALAGNYHGDFKVGFGSQGTLYGSFTPIMPLDALKHTWRYKNRLFTMLDDGTQIAVSDVSSVNFGSETNYLRLFYGYNASTTGRVYSFKQVKQSGESLNLIPCYRKSDNEPGMYDTVSGTFFTNQGTGTFIVGNDVSWEAIDLLALRRMVMLSMANAVKVKTGSFIGDGTNVIDLNVGFEPDIVFCYAPDLDLTEAGWMGQQCAIIIKNVAAVQIRHNNETTATALSTANPRIGGDNPPYGNTVDSYNPYGSYTNGVFRLTNTTNNGLTRFIVNEHYEWVAIKYS